MKKITASALALFAASTLFAESKDFTIPTGDTLTPFESGNYDYNIYYAGTAGLKARLGSSNLTIANYAVNSLHFMAGNGTTSQNPSYWNLLGNFTTNVTAASGTSSLLTNASTGYVYFQMGTFTVQNTTEGSTATALIDLGSQYMTLNGGGGASVTEQSPTLDIKVSTNIVTTNTNSGLTLANKSSLKVTNNSTLTLDAKLTSSTESDQKSKILVDTGSKLIANQSAVIRNSDVTINGQFMAGLNKTIAFESGTTVSGSGTIYANSGAFNILSGATVSIGQIVTGAGRYVTINGTLEIASATSFNNLTVNGTLLQTAGDTTTFNRSAVFNANSYFSTTGAITLDAGVVDPTAAAGTTVTIDEANNGFVLDLENPRIIFKRGRLTLNKAEAIRDGSGNLVSLVTRADGDAASLVVNAANEFKNIYANKLNMDIYLSTDTSATLNSGFSAGEGGKIVIHDFLDDMIFVKNYESIANIADIFTAYQTVDGNEVLVDQLYFNNGWLTSTNPVPEPAEWAAIFGALALGLAVYRRRK